MAATRARARLRDRESSFARDLQACFCVPSRPGLTGLVLARLGYKRSGFASWVLVLFGLAFLGSREPREANPVTPVCGTEESVERGRASVGAYRKKTKKRKR